VQKNFFKFIFLIFFVQLVSEKTVLAQAEDSLLNIKAKTLLKLLSVVSGEKLEKSDTFHVAILGDFSDSAKYQEAKTVFDELKYARNHLNRKTFRFIFHFDDYHSYHQKEKPTWDAVVLVQVDSMSTQEILTYCGLEKIISITLDPTTMYEGFAIGISLDRDFRPIILLNVYALNRAGYSFDTEVLQMTRVKKIEL
jgi:hypothetical protein